MEAGHWHEIAQSFIESQDFLLRYGPRLANDSFVTQLYLNVLHRVPDADGYVVQLGALDGGMSCAQLLLNFSESAENQKAILVGIQTGIEYLPAV